MLPTNLVLEHNRYLQKNLHKEKIRKKVALRIEPLLLAQIDRMHEIIQNEQLRNFMPMKHPKSRNELISHMLQSFITDWEKLRGPLNVTQEGKK